MLLLHGFPELAYSWRKVMPPLAAAGFHVVAPDQRGYGRTTGWSADYDGDLRPFRMLNAVRDALGLVSALGYRSVAAVVGHDFGASVAAWCALVRPDVFRSVALMSAPFAGPPALPFDTADAAAAGTCRGADIHAALASSTGRASITNGIIRPGRPMTTCGTARRACTPSCAPISTTRAPTGRGNRPHPLQSLDRRGAGARCRPTTSWICDDDMAETVAPVMPSAAEIAACRWLPDSELAVYTAEYARNGFQGGLQLVPLAHRRRSRRRAATVLRPHHRRAVDVHRRQERLGHLPAPRRVRAHAGRRLHADARLPPARRRRPLGAAGTAGTGQRLLLEFLRRQD